MAPMPSRNPSSSRESPFRGSLVALITPFRDGAVDEETFRALVDWHVDQGTHGLVPCGTTGESPTLSASEHTRVVALCVEASAGRLPVMAGTGSNNTAEALAFSRHAEEAGADALLAVTPYYNKPSQEGLFRHFEALNEAVGIPIFIYNIPGRSVADMSVETMARLFELRNIAGVKDATGDLARVGRQRHAMGPGFCQLSGEDATAVGFNAQGGCGAISVTANVAAAQCAAMQEACLTGDYGKALEINDRLMPLHEALFGEPSPSPVKYAASLTGLCSDEVRLPMVSVSDPMKERIRAALVHAGLLNG